uniref:Uncharacterized protein n=1 Tax=Anguilla anguilla TaxID=7936 RepID=A0A0E9TTS7_ANGAN
MLCQTFGCYHSFCTSLFPIYEIKGFLPESCFISTVPTMSI